LLAAVQAELNYSGSALWRQPFDQERVQIKDEVLIPGILSGMKEQGILAGLGITSGAMLALPTVAGRACERQVVQVIAALLRPSDNVIDLKLLIEDLFRSLAILTQMIGTLRHLCVEAVRHTASWTSCAEAPGCPRGSASFYLCVPGQLAQVRLFAGGLTHRTGRGVCP
jgi:hypothetical protein